MLTAGGARRIINCEIGDGLCGQLHNRICRSIHDDLEANVFYLADGNQQLLLVSLDLVVLDTMFARQVGEAIEAKTGIPARDVLLCCTHTHTGPYTTQLLHDVPRNDAYLARLKSWLVDAAQEAVAAARPALVGWARGRAHVGFNRRLCWADGSHTMYGDSSRPDFTGIEGPDDPSHAVFFAADEAGKPIAILHNNCSHATCVEGAEFASADFPGFARRFVREALSEPVPVLYLQGCSGDVSPWNMLERHHRDGERRLREIGMALAAETLRLMRETAPLEDVPVSHLFEDVEVAVRLPSPERMAEVMRIRDGGEAKSNRWEYVIAVTGDLRLYETFKDHPVDVLPVHAVRIGEFSLVTNPCEMYCQFGLDLKRRSPADVTAVSQLTDGFSGYCPTVPAVQGGGYSGSPMYWCRLEPHAGYKLVEAGSRLANALWKR